MDPCPLVRVLVGNLALKMSAFPRGGSGSGAGVHPTTAPCYCRIRLNKLPCQTATAPLPSTKEGPASCTGAFAAAFHVSKADLDRATAKPALFGPCRTARLKVAVYAGRRGATCGGASSRRLLGKVVESHQANQQASCTRTRHPVEYAMPDASGRTFLSAAQGTGRAASRIPRGAQAGCPRPRR